MSDGIPRRYVTERVPASERRVDDSLFWMSGFLFPEVREPLWPLRSFPVLPETPAPAADATTADDATLEVQTMGLQYSVLLQHRREHGLAVNPPASWDRRQLLWTDLPVFAEEPCEWHFPKIQTGFNTTGIEPPAFMRPDHNMPAFFGFLPNGDLLAYWTIAEALADEFELDIEAVHSSVDGCALVTARGVDEDTLLETPYGQGVETGIILSSDELDMVTAATDWIRQQGGVPEVFMPPGAFMFYRLAIPVMRCEMNMNRYATTHFESLDLSAERLATYNFRILDNPGSRDQPLFATERGNLVVSDELFERLGTLMRQVGAADSPGNVLPIIRTP